jgi:hypothetical protein
MHDPMQSRRPHFHSSSFRICRGSAGVIQCEREELTFLCTGNTPLALQFELAHLIGALRMAAQSKAIPPGPAATDPVDRLDKLGRLLAQGLLTEEELNTPRSGRSSVKSRTAASWARGARSFM